MYVRTSGRHRRGGGSGRAAEPGRGRWQAALCLMAALIASCSRPAPPADGDGNGALTLQIGGLPGGAAADVLVTGPDGYEMVVSASTTLSPVAVGTYAVVASPVAAAGAVYLPEPPEQSIAVSPGSSTTVSVEYGQQDEGLGAIAVVASGLPAGVAATFDVTGPDGFEGELTAGDVLGELTVGTYLLSGRRVVSTYGFEPVEAQVALNVTAGKLAEAEVVYTAVTGALRLSIEGLPAGVAAGITLTGPDGDLTADAARTLTDLPPGAYDYDAPAVRTAADETDGQTGFTFGTVAAPSAPLQVEPGVTADLALRYEPVTGSLLVIVRGLPPGVWADVVAAVPGRPTTRLFNVTGAINNLTVDAVDVTVTSVSDEHEYVADPVGQVPIAPGEVTVVDVQYEAVTGSLTLRSAGLPTAVFPEVSVTVGDAVISGNLPEKFELPAGTYEVWVEDPVEVTGQSYEVFDGPLVVEVVAGSVNDVVFTYAVLGDLTVEVTGLPDGLDADVRVTGPHEFDSGRIRSTMILRDLPTGAYTVAANVVNFQYFPQEATKNVLVDADGTVTTVRYRGQVTKP